MEQVGFYDKKDLRSENRELALKMFFRELKELARPKYPMSGVGPTKALWEELRDLIIKWKVSEEEVGTSLSLAISFPDGVTRNQYFYREDGTPYVLKHNGLPGKAVGKKTSHKKSKAKRK